MCNPNRILTAAAEKNIFRNNSFYGGEKMGFRQSERERRARARVDEGEEGVDWLSVGPQIKVLRLVKRELQEEAAQTDENMRRIAELDRDNMAKLELKKLAAKVPAVETGASVATDIAIDKANRRRQKSRPGGRLHPIVRQEIIPERRLERELNPKPRKPAEESWRTKLTASPHWRDAIKWFRMTPAEKAAAEAEIVTAVNMETGVMAQALASESSGME